MLTLHRHTGKSKEEHAAARALLDLTSEPVETDETDGEGSYEDETEEFPEPIECQSNRSTQTDKKLLRQCSTQVSETLSNTE